VSLESYVEQTSIERAKVEIHADGVKRALRIW